MSIALHDPKELGQFATSPTATALDQDAGVRKYIGDGGTHLAWPGLLSVDEVWVGNGSIKLPLFESVKFPLDGSENPRIETIDHQMIGLITNEEGSTVMLRSQKSNDGKWQKDQAVYVRGTWKDDKKK